MSKDFLDLMDNMKDTIKTVGSKKTLEALKRAKDTVHTDKIDFIIKTVLDEYGNKFSVKHLSKKNLRGDIVFARNMIFILIAEITYLLPREISPYIGNLPDYTIRNAICNYGKLDPLNKWDKLIIDRHDKLLLTIKEIPKLKNSKANNKINPKPKNKK